MRGYELAIIHEVDKVRLVFSVDLQERGYLSVNKAHIEPLRAKCMLFGNASVHRELHFLERSILQMRSFSSWSALRCAAMSVFAAGLVASVAGSLQAEPPTAPALHQVSAEGIRHGIAGFGADTFIADADGKVLWSDPRNTRDGFVLPNGHLLLTITKSSEYPGGGAIEVDRAGKMYFEYRGTQSEVNSVQPVPGGHYVLTEGGEKPRLLELDRSGKIVVEFPLQCQNKDFHMETRMARKLKNGHYLVPHLLDFAVKEYDKTGKVVWEAKTPNWPFSCIRLATGETYISCTHGNMVVEADKEGKIIWQVTNDDLPGAPIKDACGAQLLSNGHLVFTSYGSGGESEPKLTEITKDKKIVWQLFTGRNHGLHQFQILEADGALPHGNAMR